MSLETFVISGVPELSRALDGDRWWAAIERHAPRALAPVVHSLRAAAPKGKTGKLSRGFDTRTKRINQGFIQGVQVDIGARVPYGHLVERGHKIIPRGPQRKGRPRSRSFAVALKARRAAGSRGFVPGRFFARDAVEAGRAQTMSLLERLVAQDLLR